MDAGVEFRTDRLRLRPARPDDLDAIHAILTNPLAMTYWSTPPHETLQQSRDWLQSMIDISPREGEDFIVEQDGRVVGKAGLWRFPEIGFIFHPDHWGQGYAQEALNVVIGRAFDVHGLPKIDADVDPRNTGSLKLLARLGFQETARKEKTWLIADQWCDSVYLSLDEARWREGTV
jgi:ribosomal-protein-alanine N-acetyltransferase